MFFNENVFQLSNIQTFNPKHLNSSSNSNNSILINIVGKLHLMSRNVDFVFMIMFSGLPFHSRDIIRRTIFSLKNLIYISVSTRTFKQQIFQIFNSHCAWSL